MNDHGHKATQGASDRFATTQWATVLVAGSADSSEASLALSVLCQTYWYPLYVYVRRRGFDEQEAKDLTQGFFEHLLARKDIAKADPNERFRSFLLSLAALLGQRTTQCQTAQRGGLLILALDDTTKRYRLDPAMNSHGQTL
jgi:RNA polymerase sigma-70 factor (ECF subfamily)